MESMEVKNNKSFEFVTYIFILLFLLISLIINIISVLTKAYEGSTSTNYNDITKSLIFCGIFLVLYVSLFIIKLFLFIRNRRIVIFNFTAVMILILFELFFIYMFVGGLFVGKNHIKLVFTDNKLLCFDGFMTMILNLIPLFFEILAYHYGKKASLSLTKDS